MAWTIEYTNRAERQFSRLSPQVSRRIKDYLENRIASLGNPRGLGGPLGGNLGGSWRYRIGDYRVICDIQDEVMVVLVVTVGHRGQVYR